MKVSNLESVTKDIVEQIQQSFSQKEILGILESVASLFGFEYFTYARVFPKAMTRLDILIIGNYPAEWIAEYQNNKYIFVDPTIKYCASSTLPYYWKNIFINQDEEVKKFAKSCSSFGLKEGFSVGVDGNCGEFSIFSLGGSGLNISLPIEFSQPVMMVHMILPYIHDKFAQMNPVRALYPTDNHKYPNNPLQELTLREKECLLWSAEGKTAYEMALILKVSESTVNFHIKNSVNKLGCANKTHAVAKAVLLGLMKNISD